MYTAVAVSVFAGGFTEGMNSHFETMAHFAPGPYGLAAYAANHPTATLHVSEENQWPAQQYEGVDVVYGNPPCAPWSICGASMIRKDSQNWRVDPRVDISRALLGLAATIHPRVIVTESVPMILSRGRDFVDGATRALMAAGYRVYIVLVDAKFLGLPQQRLRAFIIGSRVVLDPTIIPRPIITVGDSIENIPNVGMYIGMHGSAQACWDWLRSRGQYGSMRRAFMEMNGPDLTKGRPRLLSTVVDPSLPAGTIVQDELFHWEEPRHLGVYEYKRLCGYPNSYVFAPNYNGNPLWWSSHCVSEMARAVGPVPARWLANVLYEGLKRGEAAALGLERIRASAPSRKIADLEFKYTREVIE